ncbi:MAG: hypothetical protein ACREJO_09945 [Phycisphaerales bacterium]
MRTATRSSVWLRMLIVASVLAAVLMVGSIWWRVTFDGAQTSVAVVAGSIELRAVNLNSGVASQLIGERRSVRVDREEAGWKWWFERESIQFSGTSAFAIGTGTLIAGGGRYARTTVPLWPAAAALCSGTTWLVIVDRRRRLRRAGGCCLGCGYELRGLPPGAACPECGAIPTGQISSNQLLSTHASDRIGDRPGGGGADRADGA